MANFIGRIGICICCLFCSEIGLLALLCIAGIGDGHGAEGLGEVIVVFFVGSCVVTPTSIYFGWKMTENHKIS